MAKPKKRKGNEPSAEPAKENSAVSGRWSKEQEALFAEADRREAEAIAAGDAAWVEEKEGGRYRANINELLGRQHPIVNKLLWKLGFGEVFDNYAEISELDRIAIYAEAISDYLYMLEGVQRLATEPELISRLGGERYLRAGLAWAAVAVRDFIETWPEGGALRALFSAALQLYDYENERTEGESVQPDLEWTKLALARDSAESPKYVKEVIEEIKEVYYVKAENSTGSRGSLEYGRMDGDHLAIDGALRNLAATISKDFNVQNDFLRQAEMLVARFRFDQNEANPPPVPVRKFNPRTDDIVEFIREEWGEWCRRGLLTRMKLKHHDRRAWSGVINYMRTDEWPNDLPVLTAKEYNDRWLTRGLFTLNEVARATGAFNIRNKAEEPHSPMML